MPGGDHGKSIKKPKVYEALREERGMSKSKAAAISNAQKNKQKSSGGSSRGSKK